MRQKLSDKGFAIYSDCEGAYLNSPTIDLHKAIKSKNVVLAGNNLQLPGGGNTSLDKLYDHAKGFKLDFAQWLPFAAKDYKISPDPKDYLLKPYIIMPTDLPNRNGFAFPLKDLTRWNNQAMNITYRIWKGSPTHLEHANDDPTIANGIVADSLLLPIRGYNGNLLYKVVVLMALDRTRYPTLTQRVMSNELNSVSMGAWVSSFTCSKCGEDVGTCTHIQVDNPYQMYVDGDNTLVYRNTRNTLPFEVSWVGTPAYSVAVNDRLTDTLK